MEISILNRVKKRIKDGAGFSPMSKADTISIFGPLSKMLGPSGRVTLASLKWYFQESGKKEFIEFVQNPVLMGSALTAEYLSGHKQQEENANGSSDVSRRNSTLIVNSDELISKRSGPGTSLPYAIYPFVKRPDASSPANAFMIGRAKNCDMNMKDMAISKVHAVVRIAKQDFYIQDCNSTNGTKLNGQPVADKPQILNDKDTISLGNYDFTFISAASLHDLLVKSQPCT